MENNINIPNNNNNNNNIMVRRRSKLEMTSCQKHPKHHQSPGVCSVCLRAKLSKLANHASSSSRSTSRAIANASSSELSSSSLSSLSSLSSSNASSGRSSPMQRQYHRKPGMNLSSLLRPQRRSSGSTAGLAKSRSMVFAGEMQKEDMKKSGFWSKLIGSSSMRKRSSNPKRMEEEVGLNLMHSRTMRDMLTTS